MCFSIDTPDEFNIIERNKQHKYLRSKKNDDKSTDKDAKDKKQECVECKHNDLKDNDQTNKTNDNTNNDNVPIIGRLGESDILLGVGDYCIDKKFNLYKRIDTDVVIPVSRYAPVIYLQILAFMILMFFISHSKDGNKFPTLSILFLTTSMTMFAIPFCTRKKYLLEYKEYKEKGDHSDCGLFCGETIKLFFDRVMNSLILSSCGVNLVFIVFGLLTYYVYNLA